VRSPNKEVTCPPGPGDRDEDRVRSALPAIQASACKGVEFDWLYISKALRQDQMNKLFVLVLLLFFTQFTGAYPVKGTPAPPLRFAQLLNAPAGTKTDWASLRAKVVVLEFWATSCGPCIAAIPHWNELAARLGPAKYQFITVNEWDSAEKISEFIQRKPMAGWVGVDRSGVVSKEYGVELIPATMIIDQKGRFVAATMPENLTSDVLDGVYEGQKIQFARAPESQSAAQRKAEKWTADQVKTQGEQKPVFELSLTPSKPGTAPFTGVANDTFEKRAVSAIDLIADAYQLDKARIDWRGRKDQRLYNFRVTMQGLERLWSFAIYQQDVLLALRLRVHEERETRNSLVLRTNEKARDLLKETELGENTGKLCGYYGDRFVIQNLGMDDAALKLEKLFGMPVLNETGRNGRFDVSVSARRGDLAGLTKNLEREAGLVLTEEEKPVEMLVVADEEPGRAE
jgi:uncharacterized protein (TIGR03435 family)